MHRRMMRGPGIEKGGVEGGKLRTRGVERGKTLRSSKEHRGLLQKDKAAAGTSVTALGLEESRPSWGVAVADEEEEGIHTLPDYRQRQKHRKGSN